MDKTLEITVQHQLGDLQIDASIIAGSGLTAMFGRSGAGKTSLINMIAGLEKPRSGRISICGYCVFDSDADINLAPEQRRIGYVFQEGRLFPHMSVRKNLIYGMNLTPAEQRHQDFLKIVELLDLAPLMERLPGKLSGGEKQRVAIGRALLSSPQMLLMDEPLASLDSMRKGEILDYIERLRDELTLPIIYVSHSLEEVIRLADTLVIIDQGKTVAVGSVEEICSRLDLHPLTGRYEAGAVLQVRIAAQDTDYNLTRLDTAAGPMWVPKIDLPVSSDLRLRIRARDVTLSLDKPENTSILNIFDGIVKNIGESEGNQVDVLIDAGAPVIARITRKSLDKLDLKLGTRVYALIKAAAIDRRNMGLTGKPRLKDQQ